MKAIVCPKYGSPDVLQLQEVAKPAPQDDEVLIRIYAASLNARDWRYMRAKPFFIRLMPGGFLGPKNKILGADVAGRIEYSSPTKEIPSIIYLGRGLHGTGYIYV